jgi:hypothetical protein
MLQTIQVEIDASGHIHPMEALSFKPVGRALLTLLDQHYPCMKTKGAGVYSKL